VFSAWRQATILHGGLKKLRRRESLAKPAIAGTGVSFAQALSDGIA
jgi:hypothetical protein